MDFSSILIILLGSTLGLILRILIQDNFKIKIGFHIQNTTLVNFIASFFLGILVSLNFINNKVLLLSFYGFLGCFSTFSSFIYQLFYLLEKGAYLRLILHYIEVIVLSSLFFFLGYCLFRFF